MLSLKEKILKASKDSLAAKTAFLLFKKSETVKDHGINFQFHFYDRSIYEGDHPPRPEKKDPLQPPYPPGILAAHLTYPEGSHYLQINKFMFKEGHTIGSSDNPSAMQGDSLNDADFRCFSQMMLDFGNKGIGYYNSGTQSGCSQLHKHIQYIPNDDNPLAKHMSVGGSLPYLYYAKHIDWYSYEAIKDAYEDLHSRMVCGKYGDKIKHFNFVLSNNSAFIVPRKLARHPLGITVNSIGVSGHFFTYEEDFERFRDKPLQIVTELCYAE